MPIGHLKVIEGVFSEEEKEQLIRKVTEAMVSVEGEALRDKTYVLVEEIKSGEWGIGGQPMTAAAVRDIRGG